MRNASRPNNTVHLGSVFGIPLEIEYSWFLVLLLLLGGLAVFYFPANYPSASRLVHFSMGIGATVLFAGSILAHELAHGLAARALGIQVRSVVMFIFGGITRTTADPSTPWRGILLAVSGPAANLALATVFAAGWIASASSSRPAASIAGWLTVSNLVFSLGNLLPVYPLDGGQMLRALLWWQAEDERRATVMASHVTLIVSNLVLLAGVWLAVIGAVPEAAIVIVIALIFIFSSESGRQRALARVVLRDKRVAAIMKPPCAIVRASETLKSLESAARWRPDAHCWAVASNGRFAGIIFARQLNKAIKKAPGARCSDLLGQETVSFVRPGDGALEAIALLEESRYQILPVVDEGRLVGLLRLSDLLDWSETS